MTPAERAILALVRRASRRWPDLDLDATELPDDLVRRHFLAPLAYRAGVARFRKDYISSALTAELRANLLDEATRAMAAQEIPVLLYKGIAYAGRIYTDAAERPMSDIDLLVPAARHEGAAGVLRRLGYWVSGSNRQVSRLHHAVCFKRKDAAIDLHRSVMQPWRSRIDIDSIWRRARAASQTVSEAGSATHIRPFMTMEPVDEAVLHLAHIARHELRVPIINYVDSIRLIDAIADGPARVLARARTFRIGRAVASALAMSLTAASEVDLATQLKACGLPSLPARLGALPSVREVIADRPLSRPLQIVRKALLVDGPRELAGLLAAGVHGKLAHRFRK